MNTTNTDPQNVSDGAKIFVWSVVAIGTVSCGFIGCKVLLDANRIRWSCFVLALLTLGMAVANGLDATGTFTGVLYCELTSITALLFSNLITLITLDLGGKFYGPEERINGLYWVSVVANILINMVFIVSLIMHNIPSVFIASITIDHIARMCVPVVIFISFVYAFYPVIVIGTDVDHRPVLVIAVGVWFLAGMFFLSVFYLITLVISIVFPFNLYHEINVIQTSIEAFLRFAILDFYSTQPTKFILVIAKRLFPSSVESSSNDNYLSGRYELRLGVAIKLQDDQSMSKPTATEIV